MNPIFATALAAVLCGGPAAALQEPAPRPFDPLEELGDEVRAEPLRSSDPRELLRADVLAAELPAPNYPGALRQRRVRVDADALEQLLASEDGGFPADALTVELFPGEAWPLTVERWTRTGERSFTASGSVSRRRIARWSMAVRGGVVRLNLRPGDGTVLSLLHDPQGNPLAVQTRPHPGGRCGNELIEPAAPHLNRSHGPPSGAEPPVLVPKMDIVLQLLVTATPDAIVQLGGGLAARTAVELAVEEANDVFDNSNVDAVWELEAVVQVDYDESGNSHGTHLDRLTDASDGFIDEVHEWRGATGADFVVLLVNDTDPTPAPGGGTNFVFGVAWVQPPPPSPWPGPFSTVDQAAMVGNLTLPHELGHNMGINHDLASNPSAPPINQDAYGWLYTGLTQGALRTVMGTGGATRIPFYSNPLVLFDGFPTGQASSIFSTGADAALAMNGNLFLYSQFGFTTIPLDLSESFCDFGAGPIQFGAFNTPFDLVMESVLQVQPAGGDVFVGGGGSTDETPLLWFERRIEPGGSSPQPFQIGS